MRLNISDTENRELLEKAGFQLPRFDREEVKKKTRENPAWLHFGAGNIFRAFPAMVQQQLLNEGVEEKGIIAAEGFDYEIIDAVNKPYDDLSLLVTLNLDGSIEKTVVGSVVESLKMDMENKGDFSRLREIFAASSLQMISFTITEKGYSLTKADGEFLQAVQMDFEQGPDKAQSYMGKLASLCHHRYKNGAVPVALVSMDNCSQNGTQLFKAVYAFAKAWTDRGFTEKGFLEWIGNPEKVSFPWSMIDKITPRPDNGVKAMLQEIGFEDVEGIVTSKNTFVAPFVNAEKTQYLVIEDSFPNGRPNLEHGGVLFTDRETVERTEKMKVCTCLNPLHTALAVFGCLLGYERISDEMQDSLLVKLVQKIGYQEGLPVVVDPKVLSPKEFIDTVIGVRLPNPFMPDTPQRIATDTSQKIAVRFGKTIQEYRDHNALDPKSLVAIPLALAGWCRYLTGIDDRGKAFEISSDPMLEQLKPHFDGIQLGDIGDAHEKLEPILSNENIFAVNLYDVGLGERVEEYFAEMMKKPGAVREVLERNLCD
jgi:Mannitol-1-phosphate/altronate dehydrogenases